MPPVPPAIARRLRHATGYLGLGMLAEAAEELAALPAEDQHSSEVMMLRSDLHLQAQQWDELAAVAQELARIVPDYEKGWIDWAYALRELNRVEEAKAVLLEAEPRHGEKSSILQYNMACYHCLLGDMVQARQRLRVACKMNVELRETAFADPDLKAMWGAGETNP